MTLEEVLVAIWRQALVEGADTVVLGERRFPVIRTPKKKLLQIDFSYRGRPLRGLEQNPRTGSHWAELALSGAKIMQFLSAGRYLAVVVDGKITMYGGAARKKDGSGNQTKDKQTPGKKTQNKKT
jgi:hypothetical protein